MGHFHWTTPELPLRTAARYEWIRRAVFDVRNGVKLDWCPDDIARPTEFGVMATYVDWAASYEENTTPPPVGTHPAVTFYSNEELSEDPIAIAHLLRAYYAKFNLPQVTTIVWASIDEEVTVGAVAISKRGIGVAHASDLITMAEYRLVHPPRGKHGRNKR